MSNRLGGKQGTAYTGTNANQPPNWTFNNRPPTQYDTQNVSVGDLWLDSSAAGIEKVWVLVSLAGDMVSKGSLAQWEQLGSGALETLTGNVGGPVGPDANDNVNVIGDAVTINVVGTPVNNTLTISTTGAVATQYTTDAGVAVPAAGNLNVFGGTAARDINTSGAGSTIHVDLNNTVTLGDLAVVPQGTDSLTLTTGDLSLNSAIGPVAGEGVAKIKFWPAAMGQATNDIYFYLNNIFIGSQTGNQTMTPSVALFNIGIGPSSLHALTTGTQNNAIGNGTLQNCTDGDNNNALGYVALSALTTGDENNAIGSQALAAVTTGVRNTSIGDDSGVSITTGGNNVFIGYDAGSDYTTTSSSNITISNDGVAGVENNTIRIGTSGAGDRQQNRCFIAGIRGITTGVNDAVAVLIDSAGQLGTTSSSIRYKENVKDMGDCSSPLMSLRPVTFNYKEDVDKSKAYGLIAEEVVEIFPDLVVYNPEGQIETVKYHLLAPILLNEVQKLSKRIEQLESKLRE